MNALQGSSAELVRAYHLGKDYPGGLCALDDLSFQINKGEFVFLTGPSGAGKSTLLKLLFCAERPSRGQLMVAGRSLHTIRQAQVPFLRRNIGVVFQDFRLLNDRTVYENVALALEVLARPKLDIRPRTISALRQVGLAHKLHTLPPRLSGGEQQRVAIARALVNEPALLLADEPTGNLDAKLSVEVMRLFEAANARGTTVIVATHDTAILDRFKKRRLALDDGRLVDDR